MSLRMSGAQNRDAQSGQEDDSGTGSGVEPPVGIEPTTFSLRAADPSEVDPLASIEHDWKPQ